jgi:hypothetical protein
MLQTSGRCGRKGDTCAPDVQAARPQPRERAGVCGGLKPHTCGKIGEQFSLGVEEGEQ